MTKLIILSGALFLSYKIIKNYGNYISAIWVLVGFFLLNGLIIVTDFPLQMPIYRWLIFSMILAVLLNWKRFGNVINTFPLKNSILILVMASFTIGFLDTRLSLFEKFYSPFREMTETYIIIILGYLTINSKKDLGKMAETIWLILLLVSIYGLFNYITKTNPYYDWVVSTFFSGGEAKLQDRMSVLDITQERFRANSTFDMTFNYGFYSSILTLYFYYIYESNLLSKKLSVSGIVFGLMGAVICFSRTVLFSLFIGLAIYILTSQNLTRILRSILILVMFGLISYCVFPSVKKSIDNSLDIFVTGGQEVSGSSIQMRQGQLAGAFKYFLQSPVVGNGNGYIDNELGLDDAENGVLDADMQGYESIIYSLMIEQGIIGLFTKFLFFIALIIFFVKINKINKYLASFGLAIISLFLIFSISTGPLDSWPVTMFLLGMIIKTLVLQQVENLDLIAQKKGVGYKTGKINLGNL